MPHGDRKQHLEVLALLQMAHEGLTSRVPPPQEVVRPNGLFLRYVEQTIGQFAVLKLARIITGLRAIHVLLMTGLLLEQVVIARTIDDFQQDIIFVALAMRDNAFNDDHRLLLKMFWEEQTDDHGVPFEKQPRAVLRKKIRGFIASHLKPDDPHSVVQSSRSVYQIASGSVHGHSASIMDMFAGDPPRYLLAGASGTLRQIEYAEEASNYFFRGLVAAFFSAKIIGDEGLAQILAGASQSLRASEGTVAGPL